MHFYIDGYNVLFLYSILDKSLKENREHLLSILNQKNKNIKLKLTVVFDSVNSIRDIPEINYLNNLKVIYTPKNQTADDFIIEKIKLTKHRANITVVTQDKKLSMEVKDLKAHIMDPASFMNWLNKKNTKQEPQDNFQDTKENIDRLLKIFENDTQDH